ncbi:MAG: hypothetical protein KGS48_10490 [Bacteroidetes bacterium]|nr:hypothetical protein [Bacteroidota bacterium]
MISAIVHNEQFSQIEIHIGRFGIAAYGNRLGKGKGFVNQATAAMINVEVVVHPVFIGIALRFNFAKNIAFPAEPILIIVVKRAAGWEICRIFGIVGRFYAISDFYAGVSSFRYVGEGVV